MRAQGCHQAGFGDHFGYHFGPMFDQKSMPKMEQKNNESKSVFGAILVRFGGHFWTHVGDFSVLDDQKKANG